VSVFAGFALSVMFLLGRKALRHVQAQRLAWLYFRQRTYCCALNACKAISKRTAWQGFDHWLNVYGATQKQASRY
jgi:hypothetical protein